jgi:predicted Ser/Thr protein kinase
MIRCSSCGLRLPDAEAICAVHGPALLPPLPDEPPLPTDVDFDLPGYRVLEVLGRGGFGVVYRAVGNDGRAAAIKVAHREQVAGAERLMREADALEKVGPPFAPAIYDRGTVADRYYVAMECLTSPTLARVLTEQRGPLPLPRMHAYAVAIMDALEAVHRCGLVHLDLKPENIFVEGESAKLIDFGLAKRIVPAAAAPQAPVSDDTMGTPEYMSPEQCEAEPAPDARADIYAFGVILYEMLSGAPPFFGTSAEVQESHRSRRPPRLATKISILPELEGVVLRCLAKQKERRFQSVAALRAALSHAVQAEGRKSAVAGTQEAEEKPAEANGAARGAAVKSARDRRAVGLVFFESAAGLALVQQTLTTLGGQLAQASGTKYVAVFGHELGDNAGRSAMLAAQGLVHRKMCQKVLVDVAQVLIQTRPDGARRFMSPLFTRKDRFAQPSHPDGVIMTRAAAEVMPDVPTARVEGSAELFTFDVNSGSRELTAMWVGTCSLGRLPPTPPTHSAGPGPGLPRSRRRRATARAIWRACSLSSSST